MTSQPIHYQNFEDALSSTQEELVELLLQPEEEFYPWNPAEPETEAYFAELERQFSLSDWQSEEEIANASQTLFNQLHQCWASFPSSATDKLTESLSERFARVPQNWLEAIANQVQHVFSLDLSFADQLVQCVQSLFPDWAEDDLRVFARPFAYAMRGTPKGDAEATPSLVRPVEWAELSPIEQVRLSLTVAHSALVQLQSATGNPEQP